MGDIFRDPLRTPISERNRDADTQRAEREVTAMQVGRLLEGMVQDDPNLRLLSPEDLEKTVYRLLANELQPIVDGNKKAINEEAYIIWQGRVEETINELSVARNERKR